MFNYSMQLFWSEREGQYVAILPELPQVRAQGETATEAVENVLHVAEQTLAGLRDQGRDPPVPRVASRYSGQIRVRMPRSLHERLAVRARMEDVSLNTLIISLLAEGMGGSRESSFVTDEDS